MSHDSDDIVAGGTHGTDDSQDQQFMKDDVLELIMKPTFMYPPFHER